MSFSGKATSIQPVRTRVGPSLSSECAYCYCIPKQTDEALRRPSRTCQHHPGVLPSSRDGIDSTWPRFQSASCLLRNEINYTLVVHVCPLCDLTKRVPTCVRLQSNWTLIAPLAITIVMFTFGSSGDHWRLKYTEGQSQQMAFTESPSLTVRCPDPLADGSQAGILSYHWATILNNFLGPRGPLVLPLVNPYVRTQWKSGSNVIFICFDLTISTLTIEKPISMPFIYSQISIAL